MDNFIKLNNEVFYAKDNLISLDLKTINSLKQYSFNNTSKKSRICTHLNEVDSVHEMIIIHAQGYYVRPHKHYGKSESFHMIEGEMDLVIFDDLGNIEKVIEMGEYRSNKAFYHRLSKPFYHSLIIKSVTAIFHETTRGPLNSNDTEYALWSPSSNQDNFLQKLVYRVAEYNKRMSNDK